MEGDQFELNNTSKKRKRGSNFSLDEKNLLLQIIMKHKNVVENKKTDGITWKQKELIWKKITALFNQEAPNGVYRSVDSLKSFYENRKKVARKNAAHQWQETIKTGGGPATTKVNIEEPDALLLQIMNPKTVYGLQNEFDCDKDLPELSLESSAVKTYLQHSVIETTPDEVGSDKDYEEIRIEVLENEDSESCASPSNINTSINNSAPGNDTPTKNSSSLNTSINKLKVNNSQWTARRRPVVSQIPATDLHSKYEELGRIKLEIANIQLAIIKEEQIFKKRENDLKLKSLELDIKLKQNQLKEF